MASYFLLPACVHLVIVALAAVLTGCGIYLHDDGLQKQTASAANTYKDADVANSVKAVLEAQAQLDKQDIQTVADNETAERERAIADLISSYPIGEPAAVKLRKHLEARKAELVGTTPVNLTDWIDLHAKRIQLTTVDDALQVAIQFLVRRYKEPFS